MSVEKIDYVADWPERLLSRFYAQFRGKPNLEALARLHGAGAQSLEDALQSLLGIPSIDDSSGVQLDLIGRIVRQPRGGVSDTVYRPYLRARILANRSSGGPENIYAIFAVVYGAPVSSILIPGRLAAIELRVKMPITPDQAEIGRVFLRDSKAAGVRAIFEWQEYVDAEMFTFAQATFVKNTTAFGDLTLGVLSTAGFPSTGQLVLDSGAPTETVTYTAKASAVSFVLQAPGIVNVHDVGATVELVGDAGLGFGDSGNPAIGGRFEGAADAS